MDSLREERIGEFDGEPGFAYFLRVGCGEAHKLSPNVVDDEQVAVRAVIVPQAKIGADGLAVRRIQLTDAAESQKPREGIVHLHAREIDGEASFRQSKTIPSLRRGNRKLRDWPIIGLDAKLIQCPPIVTPESLKKVVREPTILS